jgi:hypothetical protein
MAASYDALVQQHFRSTLPYWEQIYADTTVYGRFIRNAPAGRSPV